MLRRHLPFQAWLRITLFLHHLCQFRKERAVCTQILKIWNHWRWWRGFGLEVFQMCQKVSYSISFKIELTLINPLRQGDRNE